jgi:Fe-S-cluster containining protein
VISVEQMEFGGVHRFVCSSAGMVPSSPDRKPRKGRAGVPWPRDSRLRNCGYYRSSLVRRYRRLLEELDRWFAAVRADNADQMRCGRGCALCCHGLFDISLPDAAVLAEGLRALPAQALAEAGNRARRLHSAILSQAPELEPPFLLAGAAAERVDRITEAVEGAKCPLLDDRDQCLVYMHRPLACRLEGVPMIDARDGLFGDWCELNFTRGIPTQAQQNLALDYGGIQDLEDELTEKISLKLFGRSRRGLTLFIPSLVTEFDSFWNAPLP